MKFVEALWFFGNLIECADERIKYEFVNNGTYDIMIKMIERFPLLHQFFPKMAETIKTGTLLKSSMILSKIIS
jgi:hypothetical protein